LPATDFPLTSPVLCDNFGVTHILMMRTYS
jgi:hypothetical protein